LVLPLRRQISVSERRSGKTMVFLTLAILANLTGGAILWLR
jgi:hypothetical protein